MNEETTMIEIERIEAFSLRQLLHIAAFYAKYLNSELLTLIFLSAIVNTWLPWIQNTSSAWYKQSHSKEAVFVHLFAVLHDGLYFMQIADISKLITLCFYANNSFKFNLLFVLYQISLEELHIFFPSAFKQLNTFKMK